MNTTPSTQVILPPFTLGMRIQKHLGWITMLLLLAGFALLVDGLLTEMLRGQNRFDLLPASSTAISGAIPTKNATLEDVHVTASKQDNAVTLKVTDFFASYWFGNGMWRGQIAVTGAAHPGEYQFTVAFTDAPQNSAQLFRVVVWGNAQAMRAGSFSPVYRALGISSFFLAGICIATGMCALVLNFFLGRSGQATLKHHGFAEIYKLQRYGDNEQEATFGLGTHHGIQLGQICRVMQNNGNIAGEYPVTFCDTHIACILVPMQAQIRPGWLVHPLQDVRVPLMTPTSPRQPTPLKPVHKSD